MRVSSLTGMSRIRRSEVNLPRFAYPPSTAQEVQNLHARERLVAQGRVVAGHHHGVEIRDRNSPWSARPRPPHRRRSGLASGPWQAGAATNARTTSSRQPIALVMGAALGCMTMLLYRPPEGRTQVFGVAADTRTSAAPARRPSPLGRGLADLFLVAPLQQAVADVPQLQIELVVDVLDVLGLLDDRSDVALQAILGARPSCPSRRPAPCRSSSLCWRCSSSTCCCMAAASTAKRTLPLFCSSTRMLSVIERVSMYSLVLFLTSCTVTIGRLPLAITGALQHRARHRLGDHLQIGRAELIGHGLDAARIAVARLRLGAAAGERSSGKQRQQRQARLRLRSIMRVLLSVELARRAGHSCIGACVAIPGSAGSGGSRRPCSWARCR